MFALFQGAEAAFVSGGSLGVFKFSFYVGSGVGVGAFALAFAPPESKTVRKLFGRCGKLKFPYGGLIGRLASD
jgi:hypothetical protein